jgi:hypothetical protein
MAGVEKHANGSACLGCAQGLLWLLTDLGPHAQAVITCSTKGCILLPRRPTAAQLQKMPHFSSVVGPQSGNMLARSSGPSNDQILSLTKFKAMMARKRGTARAETKHAATETKLRAMRERPAKAALHGEM